MLVTDRKILSQWLKVLRLTPGEKIILGNGEGWESGAKIEKISAGQAEIILERAQLVAAEPEKESALYLAILKRENFEWSVQKGTEAGIRKFYPVISERTVKQALNLDRLRIVAREAAEQSGRGWVPEVAEILSLPHAIEHAIRSQTGVFWCSGEAKENLQVVVKKSLLRPGVFVGPEGGWSETENELAITKGCYPVSLGKLTLRAETAATIASYLISAD